MSAMSAEKKLKEIFKPEIIEFLKNNKDQITSELLQELRSFGNPGKHLALEILDFPKDSEQYYLDSFGNRISYNGNRRLKKPFTKLDLYPIHIEELEMCSNDIHYFKDNYVKIKTPKGVDFPDLRVYQDNFIDILKDDLLEDVVSLQPRQSGKSVTVSIYLAHFYTFNKDMNIGIAANKAGMSREFLDKTKNILIELPVWMQLGCKVWNKTFIESENSMRILTDATSADSFRGHTCHIVIVDECAFIRQNVWNEFADSIFPSQSSLSFKKRIIISTANGINHFSNLIMTARKENYDIVESKFDKIYKVQHMYIKDIDLDKVEVNDNKLHLKLRFISQIISIKEEDEYYIIKWKKQKKGKNGYINYEVDWRDVPRFNSRGQRLTPEEFKQSVIEKDGIVYWNQNYEGSFLGSSYTLISADKLKDLSSKDYLEKKDNKLIIYEKPIKGHSYIIGVDPAKDGSDAFAVQIIDTYNLEFKQVACANLQIEYILMPEYLLEWAEYFNNAYLIIENNEGSGQSVADMLYNIYEYTNMYFDKKQGSKKKYPGFRTTTKSRKQILQNMKLFIENNRLEINDSKTISELYQFILVNNKYQADESCHDDLVMSLALCFAPFIDTKNFEDIKLLIKTIFDEQQESELVNIDDIIIIGDFDDLPSEDILLQNTPDYNGYIMEPDGFY